MTITNVKAMVAKVATLGLVAAAFAIAAPTQAKAQVGFGVHIGIPVAPIRPIYGPPAYRYGYVHPGYYGPAYGYYGHPYGWDRHEAFRHEERFDRRYGR